MPSSPEKGSLPGEDGAFFREQRVMSMKQLLVRDLLWRRPLLSLVTLSGVMAATSGSLLLPGALADAVDTLSGRGSAGPAVVKVALVLTGTVVASMIAGQAGVLLKAGVTAGYRNAVLDHAFRLPGDDHETPPGELLSIFSSDTQTPGRIGVSALYSGTSVLAGVVALVLLALIDWRLAVVAVGSLAVSSVAARVFFRNLGAAEDRYRGARGRLTELLLDAHRGARTIRANATEGREIARVLRPLPDLAEAGRASWLSQQALTFRMALLEPTREVTLLAVAGFGLLDGRLSAGELTAALGYSVIALGVLDQLDTLTAVVRDAASFRRLIVFLDRRPTANDARAALPAGLGGGVRFEGVRLSIGGSTVLDDISFSVPAGSRVAVVGASGSGKSLLVGMIGRLTEPDEGRVMIDEVDVRSVEVTALRQQVAYAFAEPRLFGSSLEDAIAATNTASYGGVATAARAARADRFIEQLPAGYRTATGQAPLSGGELQRIGLARAFAQDARVLVLDDATSSLDTATTAEISQAIRTGAGGRTTVIVAHRAATAAEAALVVWLVDGRVEAVGPHHELWQQPAYRRLFGEHDGSTS